MIRWNSSKLNIVLKLQAASTVHGFEDHFNSILRNQTAYLRHLDLVIAGLLFTYFWSPKHLQKARKVNFNNIWPECRCPWWRSCISRPPTAFTYVPLFVSSPCQRHHWVDSTLHQMLLTNDVVDDVLKWRFKSDVLKVTSDFNWLRIVSIYCKLVMTIRLWFCAITAIYFSSLNWCHQFYIASYCHFLTQIS